VLLAILPNLRSRVPAKLRHHVPHTSSSIFITCTRSRLDNQPTTSWHLQRSTKGAWLNFKAPTMSLAIAIMASKRAQSQALWQLSFTIMRLVSRFPAVEQSSAPNEIIYHRASGDPAQCSLHRTAFRSRPRLHSASLGTCRDQREAVAACWQGSACRTRWRRVSVIKREP
jgi:hypothetical protein